MKQTAR